MTIKDKIDRDRSDEQLWKFVHINKEGRVGLVDTKIGGELEVTNTITTNNLVATKIGYDDSGADLSGFAQFTDLSSTSLQVFGDAYINGNLNVDTIFKRTITEVDIDISGNLELFHNLDVSGVITGIGGVNLLGTTDFDKINNVTIGYDLSGRGAFTDLSSINLFTKNFTSDEVGYDVSGKGAFTDLSAQNFSLFQDFTIGSAFAQSTKFSSRGTSNLILTTNDNVNSPNIEIKSGASNNIEIKPSGTGSTVFGNGTNRVNITTNGTQNLLLDTNSGTDSGLIRIITGTNGNILLSPHGNGNILLGDGVNHQKITTSGQKNLILNTNNNTLTPAVVINAGTVGNIDLKHNAAGMIIVGNGAVSGKLTSNGTNDLVLSTQSNNANSGSITIKNGVNQNILLSTNGTGSIVVGNGNNDSTITTAGAQNLVLNTNSGSSSGSIIIEDGVNGNITLSPDGTGKVIFGTSINVSGHNGVDNGLSLGGMLITSNANELNFNDGSSPGIITFNKTVVYSSDGGVNMSKLILNGSSVDVTGDELNLLDNASPGVVTNSKCVVYSAAGKVNATQLQLSGADITASADEINRTDGAQPGVISANKCVIYSSSGSVNCNSLSIGGVGVSTSATELNFLNGSSGGNIVNNKAVIYNNNGNIFGNSLIAGSGGAQGEISSNGNYDLLIKTGNTTTSYIKIIDGPDGNIELSAVGTGKIFTTSNITGQGGVTLSGTISLNNLTFPSSDGQSSQILQTNGSGLLSFTNLNLNSLADVKVETNSYYFGSNPSSTNDAQYNVGIGIESLVSTTTGDYNTSIGGLSGRANQTGNNNTSVGYYSLYQNTGSNNTAIGFEAGDTITTGDSNTLIGQKADTSTSNAINQIVIGSNAVGQGDNTAVIGNTGLLAICPGSDNSVDLGTTSKRYKNLYVKGQIISSANTGTEPFTISSTTQVNNLFATKAATVPITSTNATSCFITLVENSSGDNSIKVDTNMSYNAATNTLSVTNLNVTGTQTTTNQNTIESAGPVMVVGQDSTDDNFDRGLKFKWNNGTAKLGFFGFDDSDGKFVMIPDATESSTNIFSGSVGTLKANLEGTATNATNAVSVTGNAQTNITSVGTLTGLTVDDVNIDGKILTMTGDTGDTATFTAGTNGTLAITTTDATGANANITITADGTSELAGTAITLNSSGSITLDADGGTTTFSDNGVAGMTLTNQNLLVQGDITYNGSLGTSDDRIKHNEIDVNNGLQIIRQLVPKKYFKTKEMYDVSHNFSLDSNGNPIDSSGNLVSHSIEIGLIAQSVLQIPDLSFSVQNIGSNTSPMSLNYNNIFVQSIAAIKELDNLVNIQTSNLETEKTKILQLQNSFGNSNSIDASNQIFYGTKTFNSQINGSISGSSSFVTNSIQQNITAVSEGSTGLTIQGTGPVTAYRINSIAPTGIAPITVSSTTPVPNLNIEGNAGTVTNGVYTNGNQIIDGTKKFNSLIEGSINGNSSTVTNGVYTTGDQTIQGTKTFNSLINGSINGNALTATSATTVISASQPNIKSVGTLTELRVDNVNVDGNSIKIMPLSGDFGIIDVSTNGEMSISTTDSTSSNANINIIPDGNSNISGNSINLKSNNGNINIDSSGVINFLINGINYGSISSVGYSGNSSTVTNGIYTTSSVTNLSDVTDKGSGKIITDTERDKLSSISPYANVTDSNTVAAAGAVMASGNSSITGIKTFENIRINPNQTNYSTGLENVISTIGTLSSARIKIGPIGIPAGSLITDVYGIFTTTLVGSNLKMKLGTTDEGFELINGSPLTIDSSNYSKGFSSSGSNYGQSIEQSTSTSLQNLYFSSEGNLYMTVYGDTLTAGVIKLFIKFIV